MSIYTVTLTAEQQAALAYETEQENQRRAMMLAPGGMPQPPITEEELLNQRVTMLLSGTYMQVKGMLDTVEGMLSQPKLPAEEVIASIQSPALRAYLYQKHGITAPIS